MKIPKKSRRKVPQMKGFRPPAVVDVYAEQFSDEVDCNLKVDFYSDDPEEILEVAKYLGKVAKYLKHCEVMNEST